MEAGSSSSESTILLPLVTLALVAMSPNLGCTVVDADLRGTLGGSRAHSTSESSSSLMYDSPPSESLRCTKDHSESESGGEGDADVLMSYAGVRRLV